MPSTDPSQYPIGVFDSGLGGLTVVRELMRQLPFENIVYFGDTARVPYGTKSKESIIRFSQENVLFLLKQKVKLIIIACNTSSSLALPVLKRMFSVPIVGVIAPGAKKAVGITKNKKIGVIATLATVNSQAYAQCIKKLDRVVEVVSQACPLFVPLVEEGWFNKDVTYAVAREYLSSVKRAQVDTVILGCTHYPLLRGVVQSVMGRRVALIDSAKEVVGEVKQLLRKTGLEGHHRNHPAHVFWVSDEPRHFHELAKRFLGCDIQNVKRSNHV